MMQSSSDEFSALISGDHVSTFLVEVLDSDGMVVQDSSEDFMVGGGAVKVDRTAQIRRTATLTLLDYEGEAIPKNLTTITEKEVFNPLSFYEFRISRGVVLSSGDRELKQLGLFTISELDIAMSGTDTNLSVSLEDRSALVSMNPWTGTFNVAAGTNYIDAIIAVVDDRARWFTPQYNCGVTASTTPALSYGPDDNPWQVVLDLAEAIGMEAFFGVNGELVVQEIADPDIAPVSKTVRSESDGVTLAPYNRRLNRRDARTGVIVRGSAPWLLYPVSGEVWDDDPLSPTYRGGPIGEVPEIVQDATVTSDGMADTAAQAKFNKLVGIIDEVSFGTMVDPRLDVGDLLYVDLDRIGVDGRYILDTLNIPLESSGEMSGTTRSRRRK